MKTKKGEIYYADLSPIIGSEQGGTRPVLILQNDVGNRFSPTVIIAPITGSEKRKIPTHIPIQNVSGLQHESIVLLEQIRTIDKKRLADRIAYLDKKAMKAVERAIHVSFDLE